MSLQIETQPIQFNNTVTGLGSITFNSVSAVSLSGVFYGDGANLTGVSNYQGTDIKSLSANWQNTFVRVSSLSANWNTAYSTATAYQNISGTFVNKTLLQGTSALLTPLTLTRTLTSQLVLDTDSRLSDNRYPTSHASSHGLNGSDSLTPDFLDTTVITVYGFTNNNLNGNYRYVYDGGDPPQQLFLNGLPVWYNGAGDAYIWYKTSGGARWVITQGATNDNTPVLSQFTSYTEWPFTLASTDPVNWSNGVKLRQASISPSSLSDIGNVGGSYQNEISRFAFYDHTHPLPTAQQVGAASQTDFNSYRTSVAASTATLLPTTVYRDTSGNWQNTYNTVSSLSANWNLTYSSTTALNLSSSVWNAVYNAYVVYASSWQNASDALDYIVVNSDFNVIVNRKYLVDTTISSVVCVLPATPVTGDNITFIDSNNTWGTKPLIVVNNGNLLQTYNEPLTANIPGYQFQLVYIGGSYGWKIV